MIHFPILASIAFASLSALADEPKTYTAEDIRAQCEESLRKMPGKLTFRDSITKICASAQSKPECVSAEGTPIFHWDRGGKTAAEIATSPAAESKQLNILVIGLIHGDEHESGSLVRLWSERLTQFLPHNAWRMIPVMNPDGWKKSKRTNSRGVDLNRNFPTKDWESHAITHWERDMKKNPRRFPGKEAASEPETKCVLAQVEEFKPDFVISVHTPYGLLDLDGPRAGQLKGKLPLPLPWRRLGTLPGSLGRYLWEERNLPVLTIELKGNETIAQKHRFEFLQDEMSRIFWATSEAIQAGDTGKKDLQHAEIVTKADDVKTSRAAPASR